MNIQQAVILAGGKGTRLQERLGGLPKPLINVAGVPLIERQIELLKNHDIKRILLLVNHKADKIKTFCKKNNNWGIEITCVDEGEPRGTAGAVFNVFDLLDAEFLVVYGDTVFDVDLYRFCNEHELNTNSVGTVFLHPNDHPHDSDLVDVDSNNKVTAFYPYPRSKENYFPNLVNAALYILRREKIKAFKDNSPAGIFDFGKDLFPSIVKNGFALQGYISPEYIKDCGTPERLDIITKNFIDGKIQRSSLALPQPTVFIDRDGTLNHEVGHLNNPEQLLLFNGVPEAIRRLNESIFRTCVVTNQPVVARGECSLTELKQIHNKFETLLGFKGAFVDRIYICPHHPDKGFEGEIIGLKFRCTCRKPEIGLITKAQLELNSDLSQSWFIGDSTTDLETARRAGIKSILVETGNAGLDGKYDCKPDYLFPDFQDAVDFILSSNLSLATATKMEID